MIERSTPVIIGSRASQLAQVQARQVAEWIDDHVHCPSELHLMTTKGDNQQEGKSLAKWGYKGLFTKEIDDALLQGDVDIAVHSMKDMPSELPEGIIIGAVLEREDVRDAFLSEKYVSLEALPEGATIGTASLRRGSQIKYKRPDLKVVPFRGNVQTRLKKLGEGEVDATLLAYAGLRRLGLEAEAKELFDPLMTMIPAVAQGAIAVTCRTDDHEMRVMLAPLNDTPTALCTHAERAMLKVLDGTCRTPIAGHATIENNEMTLHGRLCHPSGLPCYDGIAIAHSLHMDEVEQLGIRVGDMLRSQAGKGYKRWKA